MKLTKTLSACLAAASLLLAGTVVQAAPTISNVNPSGAFQFQSSGTFSFTLASTPGVTDVSLQLTATPLTGGGAAVFRYLTAGNGLVVSGTPTSETLTANISSNAFYTAIITAQDATGTNTQTINFDTIRPAYTWEAEDYDFTNGMFILDPQPIGGLPSQTNAYLNLGATLGVDFNHNTSGGGAYRPAPPGGLASEGASDTPRIQYGTGQQDYDIGFNNGGDFANYTRVYPAGTYYLFLRGSSGGGSNPQKDAARAAIVAGSATLSATGSACQFSVPNGGWQAWHWVPLIDTNNNTPATVTFNGLANTVQISIVGGNCNENFYMLVPTNANPSVTSSVSLTNIYPDDAAQFEQTSTLSFTANSPVGINQSDILVQLTGKTLTGQTTSTILTAGTGLTVTGSANSWNISYSSLSNDIIYSAFIQVADVNGGITSQTVNFDTVSASYFTFEAEDFNYGGGQFIDNPQTNAYQDAYQLGTFDGVSGVDYLLPNGKGNGNYNYGRLGLTTENAGDKNRVAYTSGVTNPATGLLYQDFDCGNAGGGNWGNYTRTFPSGAYNIYIRAANGNGNTSDSASMYLVTSDRTQPNQTISKLGTFSIPSTGGWQTYQWVPLLNSIGNPVIFTGGSVQTLRVTTDNGNYNANYYMLVPANTSVHTPPFTSDVYPDGVTLFQLTNALTFTANSAAGIANNGVSVVLNGVDVSSSLSFSGPSSALSVSCPLSSNQLYTAVITLTDSYGTTSVTNKFDAFDPNSYQFEAEDYDFTSGGVAGQFIDGQINAYAGQPSTFDVDEHDDNHAGDAYRPAGNGTPGLEVENPAGDINRPAFSGYTDYNIGFNDGGNWANYTHTYPAGTYNVYMRSANPNTPPGTQANAATLSLVTGGWNTTSQTTTQIGSFQVPYSGGWHTFAWAPLMDANGNLARITLNGSTNTLRASVAAGNYNVNFYALVPADMSIPILSNVYPNGADRFQATNLMSFGASSAAGINASGVSVQLIGTNLLGQAFVTNITTANGLVISGPSTSITATLPLALNTIYTAIITVTTANGHTTSSTVSFDTVSPAFLFESEDFNYNGGQFLAGAQINGYLNLNGVAGIDANQTSYNVGSPSVYRTNALINVENAGDTARVAYAGLQDYDVGNNLGGNWQNYTRNFPAGIYNVYLRGAGGNGIGSYLTDVASLGVVAGDITSTNQTNSVLGTFSLAPKGWQTYSDLPLIDADGNYAQFVGGAQKTVRLTTDSGNYNANYLFLLPADTTLPVNPPHLKAAVNGANVIVSFLSRTNTTYQLLFKANLTDPTWTPVGSVISGNSLNVSATNAISGDSGFYRLQTN
ncbi:MAG TPA: hypothetical protein VGO57_18365 [Verrucomicrobiae bacterium]|jgi:hypothetical protein